MAVNLSKIQARLLAILVIWSCIFGAGPGGAAFAQDVSPSQDAPRSQEKPPSALQLVDVRIEPELPSFGESFQLRVFLRMPNGAMAFLPDTLHASDAVESFGTGSWNAVPVRGDSVEIRATYPLMAFKEGSAELPGFGAWLSTDDSADFAPEDAARSASELGVDPSSRVQRYFFELGTIPVAPFLPPADSVEELSPRPAADVAGGGWNVWLVLSGGLLAAAALGGAWLTWRRRRAAAAPGMAPPPSRLAPRDEALRELDGILAREWHRNGRMVEFYRTATDTLRRFAERTEPAWGTDLTSSELVARMHAKWGPSGIDGLEEAVKAAEWVKFGSHRPDPDTAEADWKAVRAWIAEGPHGRGGKAGKEG